MLAAMAAAAAAKGYARVSVADVIERAAVSRRTFYEHFDNKQECFLAAYEEAVGLLLGGIEDAIAQAAPDWAKAAADATAAYLEMLASNPDLAQTFLVEILAAGPEALERRDQVHERFARQLETLHAAARRDLSGLPEVPRYVYRACVGAIHELVVEELRRRGPASLPELLEPVLAVELSLLAGPEAGLTLLRNAQSV